MSKMGETMETFSWEGCIAAPDEEAGKACAARWAGIAKPLGSLGLLEKATEKIAALTGDADYTLNKRVVLVLCADNGVVAQGVTQTGSEVTAAVARNLTLGDASVCRMGRVAGTSVVPVDMGMAAPVEAPGLLDRRIAAGTGDISRGPAMTRGQAVAALETGIALVEEQKAAGAKILLTGEMGIGNTTTSAAMAAVLLGQPAAVVTGRGAGLSSAGLGRKVEAIEEAIRTNKPDPQDPLDVLSKLGGFDIAGLAGIFLGGAIHRVPVLVDGLISAVAALVAKRLCPGAGAAMLASHISAEPAGRLLLEALGLDPLICAGMYLGEGSGAVAALPLLDMAYAVYGGMPTFEEIEIERYVPLD